MDLLECDINMTKDGVIVISHDDDLKRQCGIARNITEFNFDEIPPMMRQFNTHFSSEPYVLRPEEDGKFTPLKDLFEIASNKLISIDLKNASTETIRKVNVLIKEYNREHLTIWGSMYPRGHKEAAEINPNVAQFYSGK